MSDNPVLVRFALAALLILVGLALYAFTNYSILQRARRAQPALAGFQPGTPAIVYFTTPDCVACKSVQRPALQRLSAQMGSQVNVIEVNAQEQPELASQWGVLSVPTTFILDSHGAPRHINHGVTRADKLVEQVRSVQS